MSFGYDNDAGTENLDPIREKKQQAEGSALKSVKGYAADQAYTKQETPRRPTIADEQEKSAEYHQQEASKARRATIFFKNNPAFSEFIELIRTGVIHIVVLFAGAALFGAVVLSAQDKALEPEKREAVKPATTAVDAPQFSTAEKTALTAIEAQKKQLQDQFQSLQQQEGVIVNEFSAAHRGWHVNTTSFAIEKDGGTKTPVGTAAPGAPPAPNPVAKKN